MTKYQEAKTFFEDLVAAIAFTRPLAILAVPFCLGAVVGASAVLYFLA